MYLSCYERQDHDKKRVTWIAYPNFVQCTGGGRGKVGDASTSWGPNEPLNTTVTSVISIPITIVDIFGCAIIVLKRPNNLFDFIILRLFNMDSWS
jgi:hypothetical protein